MAQKAISTAGLWTIVGIVVLMGLINICTVISYAVSDETNASVDLSGVEDKLIVLDQKIDNITINEVAEEFVLTKTEHEDDATEAKALELATESVLSRDFKKAVFEALENEGRDIEDYKDITKIKIVDVDVDGDEVEFDVKVYYCIDGDEDETEEQDLMNI